MVPVEKVEVARIHKLASRCLAVTARKRIQCVGLKFHQWRDIETFPDVLKTVNCTLNYLIPHKLHTVCVSGNI
jgi:hypothetical protein